MLSYKEFQNEKKVADNQQSDTNKKIGRLKKKKLHLKWDQFKKQKQEVQQNTIYPDLGGQNYYDSFR